LVHSIQFKTGSEVVKFELGASFFVLNG
jgi:hypothetical protein